MTPEQTEITPSQGRETATIGNIFSLSWQQYKQRALPILAVALIGTAITGGLIMITVLCVVFGAPLLAHILSEQAALFIIISLVCVLVLIITILALWCQTAMLAVIVDDELGIIEAFQTGWEYLWPMAWVMTILSGILITGFVFGILPSILFLIWFSFCIFTLLDDDHRGIDALLVCKEYVRGYWWNTFGKLLAIWTISIIISVIPFVGQILSLLFTPFCMLFMLIIYRDLKSIKGEVILTENSGRIFWWVVAAIGLLLPLLALAGGIIALLTGDQQWMEQIPYTMGELQI